MPRSPASVFQLVLIKPTHYDDDGYPIQWFRSAIPSNTLACLNGLAEDLRRRQVLGPGVEIRIDTMTRPTAGFGRIESSGRSAAPAEAG
jgi:hypothetical protein